MSTPIEDYALLSDLHTGPLVSRDGSVDWLCLPRFDSPAFFCAILGGPDDGRWRLSIADGEVVSRRYVDATFVLETTWRCPSGVAVVTDFLPPSTDQADLVRHVECVEGEVEVVNDIRVRFDYARATPWVRRYHDAADGRDHVLCLAGPDGLLLSGPSLDDDLDDVAAEEGARRGRLGGRERLRAGGSGDWQLTWFPSWEDAPAAADPDVSLRRALAYWRDWASGLDEATHADPDVLRSLLVLRALTHSDTGGIVAAPTASLPEAFGGSRNWDYRYTWLRDASMTIEALLQHGLTRGALHWRDWLLRAVAGDMDRLRIMYGIGGERDLDERELDHLEGYEGSRPVRVGNGAAGQHQADVPGEVMLALGKLRDAGVAEDRWSWGLQKQLLVYCEAHLDEPDLGIWEMRGEPHHFTHGRAMMWAAFDQGVTAVERHGLDGDVEHWRELRGRLGAEIDDRGYDAEIGSFVQAYGSTEVDASLLQLPHTGFVAPDDPRMLGTVARIERDLVDGRGFVHRYRTEAGLDGLEGEEHPFLICCFWLVMQYAETGREQEARALMDRLRSLTGELGLLAEEYDPAAQRHVGNYPQAFSHLGLVQAADTLARASRRSTTSGEV